MKKSAKTQQTAQTTTDLLATRREVRIQQLRAMGYQGEIPEDDKEVGRLIHQVATQKGSERAPVARATSIRNLRAMGYEGEIPESDKELGRLVHQVALSVAADTSLDPIKLQRTEANLRAMGYQGDIPQNSKELGQLVNKVAVAVNQQKATTGRATYLNQLAQYAAKGYAPNLSADPSDAELKAELQRLATLVASDRRNAPASEGQIIHAQRLGIDLGNASFAEARKILGSEVRRLANA